MVQVNQTYKMKNNFINGMNPKTGKENILFKAGDTIIPLKNPYKRYIFNKYMTGIDATPTVAGAYYEETDGVFIPMEYLEPANSGIGAGLPSTMGQTTTTLTNTTSGSPSSKDDTKKWIIGGVILVATAFLLKKYKVIKF